MLDTQDTYNRIQFESLCANFRSIVVQCWMMVAGPKGGGRFRNVQLHKCWMAYNQYHFCVHFGLTLLRVLCAVISLLFIDLPFNHIDGMEASVQRAKTIHSTAKTPFIRLHNVEEKFPNQMATLFFVFFFFFFDGVWTVAQTKHCISIAPSSITLVVGVSLITS